MDKPRLNFVIDCLMFVLLSAIAGIGLLMKYVLIPGRERWVEYGRNVELYFYGMDRHDWGDIHFYLALILFAVLSLHIYLHWQMIVALFHRLITAPTTRTAVFWTFLIICLILLFFSFFITPQVEDIGRGRGRRWHQSKIETTGPRATETGIAASSWRPWSAPIGPDPQPTSL